MTWHPWRVLRPLAHLTVDTDADLPRGRAGDIRGNLIRLRRGLSQAQRRSTLSHELGHHKRGVIEHIDPRLAAREERAVDAWAARRLIPLPMLADVLRWTDCLDEAAWECWVDRHTVCVRLATLTPAERDLLARLLADDERAA